MPLQPFERLQQTRPRQNFNLDTASSGIAGAQSDANAREAQLLANIEYSKQQKAQDQFEQIQQPNAGYDLQPSQEAGQSAQLQQFQQAEGVPRVTQTFGQKSQYDVFSGGVNYGVDFGVKTGTPVGLPAGEWQVVEAFGGEQGQGYIGNKANRGYGNSILVKNAKTGETLRLSHLSKVNVRPGQVIPGGTVIGATGATGNVTGPHLDVEYRDRSGRLNDVLKTPYASSLVGSGGGASNGRGGGFIDSVKEGFKNFANTQNELVNRYGREAAVNARLSSTPILKNIDYGRVQEELQQRGMPGQVLTGAIARRQQQDPSFQAKKAMSVGAPISETQRNALGEDAVSMVAGSIGPISQRERMAAISRAFNSRNPLTINEFSLATESLDDLATNVLPKRLIRSINKTNPPGLQRTNALIDEIDKILE